LEYAISLTARSFISKIKSSADFRCSEVYFTTASNLFRRLPGNVRGSELVEASYIS
jgi:hypothetical protein